MTKTVDTSEKLTEKQRIFCEQYVIDWNATRAAKTAGYSEKTAYAMGSENLSKPEIQAHIKTLKGKTEELAGVSKLLIAQELMKIVRGSAASMRKDWAEVKDWTRLTLDEKSIIAEIEVTNKSLVVKSEGEELERDILETKIKYKTYDKLKAMEMLNRMFGFNSPEEVNVGTSIPAFRWAGAAPRTLAEHVSKKPKG